MVIERAESTHSCDVVILGAGYAGLLAALRLRRRHLALRVIMVNATDRFVERVRLQESVAAKIEPRIPSIAAFVKGRNVEFIAGEVIGLDPARKLVRVESGGARHQIAFGQAILCARLPCRPKRGSGRRRACLSARARRRAAWSGGAAREAHGERE